MKKLLAKALRALARRLDPPYPALADGQQFSGTGTTVRIYGLPTTDANAIANAVTWSLRSAL